MIRSLLILFCFVTLCSCGGKPKEVHEDSEVNTDSGVAQMDIKSLLSAGTLIPRINCPGDPALSFAIYVPEKFKGNRNWPVLLFFDPHADGSFPLQKYKALADTYGYILLGSNDSKNGNSKDQTAHIVEELVKVIGDLPVDPKRVYTAGFSGGGRVAAILALNGGVQGLAICGAGFPAEQWKGMPPSVIIGIAGNDDMNLNELVAFKPIMEGQYARFQLIRTDGGHAWPDPTVFETTFMAFESYAMRDSLIPKDDAMLRHIDDKYRALVNKLSVAGKIMETLTTYEAWIKSLTGLHNVNVTTESFDAMQRKPEYKMVRAKDAELFKAEMILKEQYQVAVGNKDTTWWQAEMRKIRKASLDHSDPLKASMHSRVLGYLSLYTYSLINRTMPGGASPTLVYLCTLYRCIDPENPESWYLSAQVAMMMHDKVHATGYLTEAQACGMNDRTRLMNDPVFTELSNHPAFIAVLAKMTK